jgi:glutamate carboxypeptidase
MVGLNSFTSNAFGVNQLSSYIMASYAHLGFSATLLPSRNPQFGNHLYLHRCAETSSSTKPAPAIAMISHLDTVFSPEEEAKNNFHFRIEGKRAYGPGAVDIKGGSVMMLMILDTLHRFAPRVFENTEWFLAYNASEEVLSNDFGEFLLARLPASTCACLVFEGGTPIDNQQPGLVQSSNKTAFSLVTERKGRAVIHVKVEGKSAHAGNYHANGANAIVQLAHTIQDLAALTDYQKQVTVNVGTIKGGSVINRVPHEAEASLELRAFSPEIFQETIDKILALEKVVHIRSRDGYACKVSLQIKERTEPWPENTATNHLFSIWKQKADEIGIELISEARGGLSDGNFLWDKFPTLDGLGPVGANAHCSEQTEDGSKEQEYVELDTFITKTTLNTLAIIQLAEQNN